MIKRWELVPGRSAACWTASQLVPYPKQLKVSMSPPFWSTFHRSNESELGHQVEYPESTSSLAAE